MTGSSDRRPRGPGDRSPEDEEARRAARRAADKAAGRMDADPARLGAELAAAGRPADESETADALKRAAENDGRV